MRFFVWFFLLILFWSLVELSFLGVLLPHMMIPGVMLALAGALVIALDVRIGFWWALGGGILFDLLHAGEITWISVLIACFAYGMSFLTRRLTLVASFWTPWFLALAVTLVAIGSTRFIQSYWPAPIDMVIAFFLTVPVYTSVERLNEWLHATSLSEFRGLRHS